MHTDLEHFTIGTSLVLKTNTEEEVKGDVFAWDQLTESLVLLTSGSKDALKDLRLLRASHIKEVVSSTPPASDAAKHTRLPHIDFGKCREREARAVAAADAEAARKGPGVTEEAQLIFDSLVKTMPCRWKGKSIVVLGEVSIAEPYTLDSIASLLPGDAATLERVKIVLEAERKRLGLDA